MRAVRMPRIAKGLQLAITEEQRRGTSFAPLVLIVTEVNSHGAVFIAKKAAKRSRSMRAPALHCACQELGSSGSSCAVELAAAKAFAPKSKSKSKSKRTRRDLI